MDKKIILLLFALRTLSAEIENIPVAPAPTLPDLDFSAFPNYIQRLLTSRPSLNKVPSEPLYAPQPWRTPNTYGMNLKGDKMEIWNNVGGRNLYINDFAPLKLPSVSTETPEIYDSTTQASREKIPANVNHRDYNHKSDYNQKITSISIPQKLKVKIPAVETDQEDNNDYIPSITTLKPAEIFDATPQTLLDESINQQDNSAENATENEQTTNKSAEIERESVENTNKKDEIEKSFDNISDAIGPNNGSKNNLSSKTYGMKLTGDHGYIWNDLSKPGIHYNVGEMSTSENTNLTTKEEKTSEPVVTENPKESTNSSNFTTDIEKDNELNVPLTTENFTDSTTSVIKDENSTESYDKATTETYIVNPTTEANNKNEDHKPPKNITPELDELLKKYIEKLVKEEIAKQLGINRTKTDTEINNGSGTNDSGHEETQKEDKLPTENNKNETDCEQYKQKLDGNGTKCQNNSGNIIGNTNIYVFYPKDKIIQSILNDTIMGKPVPELLNDINVTISHDEIKEPNSEISNTLTEQTEIPDITITSELPSDEKDEGLEKYKDNETAIKEEENVTNVESSVIDEESNTT